jgi:hypothetical protein
VRTDQPGPLSEDERTLLNAFLSHDFPGVQELREQALHVTAKKGCQCGCGTIDFVLDETQVRRSASPNPVPVDAVVEGGKGDAVGGLILFVRDGLLQSLEVYSHADPLPLPTAEQVTWRA